MRRAFTLIELLVVIAIIAILASILFPVFARAKAAAAKTADIAQLRQVSMAINLYAADNEDRFPMLFDFIEPGQTRPDNLGFNRWPWLVLPYAKSFQVFFSPADRAAQEYRRESYAMFGYTFGLLPSWGFNGHYLSPGEDAFNPDQFPFRPIGLGRVEEPSATVMLANSTWFTAPRRGQPPDKPNVGYFRVFPPKQWAGAPPLDGLSYGHVWPRQPGGVVNVAWVDGSAKGMRLERLREERLWRADKTGG
jgi:prepilin-type N-terminal cleavage/methylation domain-containing protein/prepilin-type processing-associated H-X9-DG protein